MRQLPAAVGRPGSQSGAAVIEDMDLAARHGRDFIAESFVGSLVLLGTSNDGFPMRFFSAARCWVGRHKLPVTSHRRGPVGLSCRHVLYQFVKVLVND